VEVLDLDTPALYVDLDALERSSLRLHNM